MADHDLVIAKGKLEKGQLKGKTALITGAGGGIGYEAARAFLWLGARVILAEIDKVKGKRAELELNREFGGKNAWFVHTDIGNERSVKRLIHKAYHSSETIDILINNATVAPMGSVHEVGIGNWDLSYRVNLKGPVLLISHILPRMLKRNSGIIVLVPSSGAAPYMGAYEVFKTSQVELANTLAAELEQTDVIAYSIGPGIVKTDTAQKAIEEIAPLYGKSVDEFYRMSESLLLTAEEAGAGFAASAVLAQQYRGLEIGSMQALMDAGISLAEKKETRGEILSDDEMSAIEPLFADVRKTFVEQMDGWSARPIFERQWLMRDFKKHMGAAPEYFLDILKEFDAALSSKKLYQENVERLPLEKMTAYYNHQIQLLKGYEKDKNKVREYSEIMNGWIERIEELKGLIAKISP
jgi:NAD(P)-dependent dehydrogenase (short-subunit alcohol dehydrogenase family)